MPDTTILAAGASAVPEGYTVPASQSIQPKAVRAVIDGTGASGAFYPVLQIVSDSGIVVAEGVCTTQVAAGGSAQVSWFPHVAPPAAAAESSLSYAYINASNLTPASGASPVAIDLPSGGFKTSDAAAFAYDVFSGVHGIHVKSAGTYLVIAGGWYDSGSAAAGQFAQINLTSPGLFTNELAIGPFENFGGGDFEATCLFTTLWQGGGAAVTGPNMLLLEACENSTGGANLDAGLQVITLSSVVA